MSSSCLDGFIASIEGKIGGIEVLKARFSNNCTKFIRLSEKLEYSCAMFWDLVGDFLWIGHNSLTNRSKKHFEVISRSVVHGIVARYTQQGFTLRKNGIAVVAESALKLGWLKKYCYIVLKKY